MVHTTKNQVRQSYKWEPSGKSGLDYHFYADDCHDCLHEFIYQVIWSHANVNWDREWMVRIQTWGKAHLPVGVLNLRMYWNSTIDPLDPSFDIAIDDNWQREKDLGAGTHISSNASLELRGLCDIYIL